MVNYSILCFINVSYIFWTQIYATTTLRPLFLFIFQCSCYWNVYINQIATHQPVKICQNILTAFQPDFQHIELNFI